MRQRSNLKCVRAWVLIAPTLLTATVCARSDTSLAPPASFEELAQLVGTEWYRVELLGQPSGYARIETSRIEGEDGLRLRVTEDLEVRFRLSGNSLQISKSQVTVFDRYLRPVSIDVLKDEAGQQSRLSVRLEGDTLLVDGGTTVQRVPTPPDLGSDLIPAVRLIRGEFEVGDSFEFTTYDPDLAAFDHRTITAERREMLDGLDALMLNTRSETLGVDVETWVDSTGVMLRQIVPGVMGLTLERVTESEAMASLVGLEVRNRIAVSERLPDVSSLRQVNLRVSRSLGSATELLPIARRQQLVPDGEDALVTIERETPPVAGESVALPIADESLALYLAPTAQAQCDDPRIVQTAREIVGDETDAWRAAQMLCAWVYHSMRKVDSEPRPMSAVEILEALRGDCTEHAILFAALGRAVGLPTRMVTGLAGLGQAFSYHAWTEVYIGRWVEMDATWGQLTADAGHLQIAATALDQPSYVRACLATGRTLGAIQIDLLGYVAADGREIRLEERQP